MADEMDIDRRLTRVETNMEIVMSDLYNHGKDGIKTTLTSLVARLSEKEEQDAQRSKRLDQKINIFMAFFAGVSLLLLAIGTLFAILEYARSIKSGEIHLGDSAPSWVVALKSAPLQETGNGAAYTATVKGIGD